MHETGDIFRLGEKSVYTRIVLFFFLSYQVGVVHAEESIFEITPTFSTLSSSVLMDSKKTKRTLPFCLRTGIIFSFSWNIVCDVTFPKTFLENSSLITF